MESFTSLGALVFIQVPWFFPSTSEYIATFCKGKETIYLKSELQLWKADITFGDINFSVQGCWEFLEYRCIVHECCSYPCMCAQMEGLLLDEWVNTMNTTIIYESQWWIIFCRYPALVIRISLSLAPLHPSLPSLRRSVTYQLFKVQYA